MATPIDHREASEHSEIKSIPVVVHKSPKLEAYQRMHRQLLDEMEPVRKERNKLDNKLRKLNAKAHSVGMAIYDMKHNGNTPEITDHAIVRYLERVKGVDILELKLAVAEHKNAQRVGNVIVTVNADDPVTDLATEHPDTNNSVSNPPQQGRESEKQ
jgi:hypothetical protein